MTCTHEPKLDVAGGCPACLLEFALGKPVPPSIDGYEIVDEIGRGAMGTVYRALQSGARMTVALKVIHEGEPANEIENHALLKHPNIVKVHDGSGLAHDPPYFAMELVEGGTLADERWKAHFHDPARALELTATLADAVQYAHERRIFHRDLKPANVLIDEAGRPHVSDFGIAKRGDESAPRGWHTIAGSLGYMSPEQAGAVDAPVTTASDVYGLGAILYELLTGRCPRSAKTIPELLKSFETTDVHAPRTLARGVSRDLEAVCLRALRTDPDKRYRAAADLARDLRLVARDEELSWLPMTVWERAARSARRHKWLLTAVAAGALLVAVVDASSYSRIEAQEIELREVVLRTNAGFAKAQAQAALSVLEKYSAEVTKAAAEPYIEQLVLETLSPEHSSDPKLSLRGFDSVFVIGCDGLVRAHSQPALVRGEQPAAPPGYFKTDFSFRDYYRGARELARKTATDAYVSSAFRSQWDGRFKFALSTPIYRRDTTAASCEPGSKWIGVFLAARSASSTLERVQIADIGESGHFTALFGPRDRERPLDAIPKSSALHVIVHSALEFGDERPVDQRLAARLIAAFGSAAPPGAQFQGSDAPPYSDADYTDPLADKDARWLGGFYPVGRTGFFVSVQTPYGSVKRPIDRSTELLVLNLGFGAFAVVALLAGLRTRRPKVEESES